MRQLYFAFLFSSLLVNAQDFKIKDPNFERALIERGYDVGSPDGFLNRSNLTEVTYLDVSGESIEDLSGIEAFANLQVLIADNNKIRQIDLSLNQNIEEVSLYNNRINSANFSGNPKLEKLNAFKNTLSDINLTNNRNLTFLAVADNNLTSLDLSNNKKLGKLYCQGNQLSFLNVSNSPELTIVNCEYNNLSQLLVANSAKLEVLNAANNNLTEIDVTTNNNLRQLNVLYNRIGSMDLSVNQNLSSILVAYNELTSLNIRNGHNTNIQVFRSEGNDKLTCITADDVVVNADENSLLGRWNTDFRSQFSDNCDQAEKNDVVERSFSFFVGTDKTLNISSDRKASLHILNLQGVAVLTEDLDEGLNAINLNNALSDVYVLQINSEVGTYTKKFILN
ncbi:T9SS type A sorting domain-containing protein [Ascidiimonas aurantiaca]|uniref:T9SS type A sorting domain-containing protein n=1 Tax=Ascidiimonas aurantiaca TaxID=1685432 RepID=UPI0030EDE78D